MKQIKNVAVILSTLFLFNVGCNTQNGNENEVLTESTVENSNNLQPQNIILMIGDGMGLTQITAGMLMNNNRLNLEKFPYIGLIKTSSFDNLVTDSAAGATAFSVGKKTYNGAIGVNSDTLAVETILEIAGKGKYTTGLVATSSITHATPASFFAHQPSRSMDEEIAMDMISAPVDFFIGGGKDFFNKRSDQLNLLDSLKSRGFKIYSDISSIPTASDDKVASFIGDRQPISMSNGRGNVLSQASGIAVDYLSKSDNFFLMIEGSQIDWEGHNNNSEGIIAEMIDFDEAIGRVLEFAKADGNTLVIVTADHETGGYSIRGKEENGNLKGAFTTKGHTGDLIPVFAYGPGAENFSGIYENIEIFNKMLSFIKEE